jgi:hypothetical protein
MLAHSVILLNLIILEDNNMPPRSRRGEQLVDIVIDSRRTLSRKLTTDVWEMSRKLDIEYECCICLDPICCDKCITVLNCECGAKLHARCWLNLEGNVCPICRN